MTHPSDTQRRKEPNMPTTTDPTTKPTPDGRPSSALYGERFSSTERLERRLLLRHEAASVRSNRIEHGSTERGVLKRRAVCRDCGEQIPKGTTVIRFAWDFAGFGSWTATWCAMHEVCPDEAARAALALARGDDAKGGAPTR